MKAKLYARKCSATGSGMWSGYVVNDGEYYFKRESDLVNHLRENGDFKYNDASDEYIVDESYEIGYHYWTEWESFEDAQYIENTETGKLHEIDVKQELKQYTFSIVN